MARDVGAAFDELLGRLTPTTTETKAAASHRTSIEQSLQANHGLTNFFRSGSFGFGTSVSGFSDIDYFAVFPPANLKSDSNQSLREIGATLTKRFPTSNVSISSPTIAIPFGNTRSERHEITPAFFIENSNGYAVYGIPDRVGGWMRASPGAHAAFVNSVDTKLSGKVKPLIRLAKAWKYYCNVPIRSFYLEIQTALYAQTQSSIFYRFDISYLLDHLVSANLQTITDPMRISGSIYSAFSGQEFDQALLLTRSAQAAARTALVEDSNGRTQSAFHYWDRVYNNYFPGFY